MAQFLNRWWVAIPLLLVSLSFPVFAQEIRLNTPIEGSINSGESTVFSLIAREGQVLSVYVHSRDNLDPIITILDRDGTPILINDDYQYPDSRDAMIEAFSAPYTGSYTIEITGYGDTAGSFDLLVLPGYSQVAIQDMFEGSTSWRLAMLRAEPLPALDIQQGSLSISQSGVRQIVTAYGPEMANVPYYYGIQVAAIDSADRWETGLVFHYRNENLYYRFLVNSAGAWSLQLVAGGQTQILRDWSTHPAITSGETAFALGVLVNTRSFEFFYNNQFIGSVTDSSLSDGQIGVTATTADSVGSSVAVSFRSLLVTVPVLVNGAPILPDQLVGGSTNYTVRELERRQIIPSGGSMALNVDSSYFQNVSAGVTRYPIGGGIQPANFAISALVSWQQAGNALQGCGLVLRDSGESENYVLAFVNSNTGYGLSERRGSAFGTSFYHDIIPINPQPYRMLVIASGKTITLYMNDRYAGTISTDLVSGGIAEAVVNFNAVNTVCTFDNLWVWQWE
jgi:hypothetical protein